MAAAQSGFPGRKTSPRWARFWGRGKGALMLRLLLVLLAVQHMNGAAQSPCTGSWETLRPSLYGNHTPATVSRTLPLHSGLEWVHASGPSPLTSVSPLQTWHLKCPLFHRMWCPELFHWLTLALFSKSTQADWQPYCKFQKRPQSGSRLCSA